MDLPRTVRQRLDAQLAPLAGLAASRGINGDGLQWGVLGVAASVGALLLLTPALLPSGHGVLLLLPAALAARALALAVAEVLARDHPEVPQRDPAVREVTDAGAELLLYLPVAAYPGVAAAPVVLLVALGLLAEIAGLSTLARGGERRRDGPMTLRDRAIVFAIVGLILALDPGAAPWLPWLLLPAAALALATVYSRMRGMPASSERH
jgi:hypothetical protein